MVQLKIKSEDEVQVVVLDRNKFTSININFYVDLNNGVENLTINIDGNFLNLTLNNTLCDITKSINGVVDNHKTAVMSKDVLYYLKLML